LERRHDRCRRGDLPWLIFYHLPDTHGFAAPITLSIGLKEARSMGLSQGEKLLLQKIRRFGELEREFLKYNYETSKPVTTDELMDFMMKAIRIASEAFTIKSEILYEISELREVRIHDQQAIQLLDRIKKGDPFYSISFYEKIFNDIEEVPASMDDFLIQKFDKLFEEFHSWFDLIGYYLKKTRIGPIISASKIPDHLLAYFDELKEAYAFQQYRSSLALCRSLLEMGLYDKLKARGIFKATNPKVTHIDIAKEDNLNRYINIAKWEHLLSPASHEIAHKIRTSANSILHPKDKEPQLNAKQVFETIFDTIRIIETLYR
jgi:hypothetical protein